MSFSALSKSSSFIIMLLPFFIRNGAYPIIEQERRRREREREKKTIIPQLLPNNKKVPRRNSVLFFPFRPSPLILDPINLRIELPHSGVELLVCILFLSLSLLYLERVVNLSARLLSNIHKAILPWSFSSTHTCFAPYDVLSLLFFSKVFTFNWITKWWWWWMPMSFVDWQIPPRIPSLLSSL